MSADDLVNQSETAACRVCGEPTFLADGEGPAHPCCVLWARVRPVPPCPACVAATALRGRENAYMKKAAGARARRGSR